MKCLRIIFLLFLFCDVVYSQTDSVQRKHNLVYLEAAGIGGYGSVNYERLILDKYQIGLGIRIGISTYHLKDYRNKFNPDFIIPFSVNSYYGKNHKVEVGIGEVLGNIVHADFEKATTIRKTKFHTAFSVGYRYQRENGGFFFRCVYSPIIEQNKYFRHWGGIAVGYSF